MERDIAPQPQPQSPNPKTDKKKKKKSKSNKKKNTNGDHPTDNNNNRNDISINGRNNINTDSIMNTNLNNNRNNNVNVNSSNNNNSSNNRPKPPVRYDPRAPLPPVRVINNSDLLESLFGDLRHRSPTPDTPLVLVRHRYPIPSTPSNLQTKDEPERQREGEAISLVYSNTIAAVIDLSSVPIQRLVHLFIIVPCLVVADSSVFAIGLNAARAANSYDLMLGRELLDGTFLSSLYATAKSLDVRISLKDRNIPICPNKFAPIIDWRNLVRVAMDARAVYFALCQKFSNHQMSHWSRMTTVVMNDLQNRISSPSLRNGRANNKKDDDDYNDYRNKFIPFRAVGFDAEDGSSFTLMKIYDVDNLPNQNQSKKSTKNKSKNTMHNLEVNYDDADELGIVDTRTNVQGTDDNIQSLLSVLPPEWQDKLSLNQLPNLIDIQMDVGRPAYAHFRDGMKLLLSHDMKDPVTQTDLTNALSRALQPDQKNDGHDKEHGLDETEVERIQGFFSSHDDEDFESQNEGQMKAHKSGNGITNGTFHKKPDFTKRFPREEVNVSNKRRKIKWNGFDEDNRGGIPGTLHRLALLYGRTGQPVGLTLRIGRHVHNAAAIITDILNSGENVLIVGNPGSGKTTIVRDAARMLACSSRVMIVDSSDEIGGPGPTPHLCVGDARRMSVLGGKRGLASALLEAVENHTPDVLVADEISDRNEVAGMITAKERGVIVLASAHGSLKSLIRNPALRGLLGGMDRVTLSDAACAGNPNQKVRQVRAYDAVFDTVVELCRNNEYGSDDSKSIPKFTVRIIRDVQSAVDTIMAGKPHWCEMRWRGHNDAILSTDVCL